MRRSVALCLLASLLLATHPQRAAAKDDPMTLAASSNAFALDLYQRVRTSAGNLALGPASISTALAMTWAGARGDTAAQMAGALHFSGGAAEVLAASGKLAASLEDPARGITLRIANRLFGEATAKLEPAYLAAVKQAFGAPLEAVDFKTAYEAARVHINAWVEERTEKRIKDLIPPRALSNQTRLVLVNAMYFLADWHAPFEPTSTHPASFYTATGEVKVPTMNRSGLYRYVATPRLAAIELPYKGETTSMLIVLPVARDGLAAVEAELTPALLDSLVTPVSQRVLLSLPRFEVQPAEPLALADELQELGMKDAFERGRADFTGIANPPSPADRLFISQVFHKAFVKVDEKGTEAAAATAVVMSRAGSAPMKSIEMKVDHPFLFFIRDRATGLILFMGRVADPSKT